MLAQGAHPVLAVKGAKVSDFNGRTLSTVGSSVVTVDPDAPEAGQLRHWRAPARRRAAAAPPALCRGAGMRASLSGLSGRRSGEQQGRTAHGRRSAWGGYAA